METDKYDKLYSAAQLASMMGINEATVKEFIKSGFIKGKTTSGGHYKGMLPRPDTVPRKELEEMESRAIKAETMLEMLKNILIKN